MSDSVPKARIAAPIAAHFGANIESPVEAPAEADLETRICKAALSLLEAEGADAVTLRRVSEATGLTPRVIHTRFSSREEILERVSVQEFEVLSRSILVKARRGSTETRLTNIVQAYLDYAFANPRIFDYLMVDNRPNARRYPDDFRARTSPSFNPLADTLAKAIASGDLRKDDIPELALQVWAQVHGYLALYRANRFNLTQAQLSSLVRRAIRRLMRGLKSIP